MPGRRSRWLPAQQKPMPAAVRWESRKVRWQPPSTTKRRMKSCSGLTSGLPERVHTHSTSSAQALFGHLASSHLSLCGAGSAYSQRFICPVRGFSADLSLESVIYLDPPPSTIVLASSSGRHLGLWVAGYGTIVATKYVFSAFISAVNKRNILVVSCLWQSPSFTSDTLCQRSLHLTSTVCV